MTKMDNMRDTAGMYSQKGGKQEITIGELFSYWERLIRYQVKPSTYACYCTIIQKHVLPDIGGLSVPAFDNEQLKQFFKRMQEQRFAGNTQRLIIFLLKSVMKSGEEAGYFPKEPLRYHIPRSGGSKTRLMSQEHFQILLGQLLKARNNFELGLLISLCTGIRVGELCGLQWEDIDLAAGELRIRRTVSRIQNSEAVLNRTGAMSKTIVSIGTPKTETSARDIPLPDFIIPFLKAWRGEDKAFVLTGTDKCMEPRGVQRRFKNLLKKQGIPNVNIHSLRHSFASNWIENGFDTKALSEILGHSSVKITMDIYVHSSMKQKKSYMNRLLSV